MVLNWNIYIWMYSVLFVVIFGWKCMILVRKCACYKRGMFKDYFPELVMNLS